MAAPSRRWFAVPSWTERAVLVALGVWALAYSVTAILAAVNTAGAWMLPNEPTGPNSWRSAQPLGNTPFRLQAALMLMTPLALFALFALGLTSWGDRTKWRRFVVVFGCFDALILIMAYQALAVGGVHSNDWAYFMAQLSTAPFVAMGIALAWPSRAGRSLAIGGAALLFASYANVYWMDNGVEAGSWWTAARFGTLIIVLAFARAIVPALIGAGILLAARQPSSGERARPAAGSAPPEPNAR